MKEATIIPNTETTSISTILPLDQTRELETSASGFILRAQSITVIKTDEEQAEVAQLVADLDTITDKLTDLRTRLCDPAYKAWKNLSDFFKRLTDPPSLASKRLRTLAGDYQTRKEAARAAEEAKAAEKYQAKVERAMERGHVPPPPPAPKAEIATAYTTADGTAMRFRSDWRAEVLDLNLVPVERLREFVRSSTKHQEAFVSFLEGLAKTAGVREVPGCRISEVKTPVMK